MGQMVVEAQRFINKIQLVMQAKLSDEIFESGLGRVRKNKRLNFRKI